MSDKQKEQLMRIIDAAVKLPPFEQGRILGVAEGMELANAEAAKKKKAEQEQAENQEDKESA